MDCNLDEPAVVFTEGLQKSSRDIHLTVCEVPISPVSALSGGR